MAASTNSPAGVSFQQEKVRTWASVFYCMFKVQTSSFISPVQAERSLIHFTTTSVFKITTWVMQTPLAKPLGCCPGGHKAASEILCSANNPVFQAVDTNVGKDFLKPAAENGAAQLAGQKLWTRPPRVQQPQPGDVLHPLVLMNQNFKMKSSCVGTVNMSAVMQLGVRELLVNRPCRSSSLILPAHTDTTCVQCFNKALN